MALVFNRIKIDHTIEKLSCAIWYANNREGKGANLKRGKAYPG